ncbi:unnamed protein product [Mytilus coruscus]|uniref:G-protein coupled receptors family 1 profile domain-containing protein n=1 Tax=Mytilus coruscus TaxID=42192 RepID=A0A6J8D157_MYTCO|nr:unnamed protein product [Mytilus coruscus]
MQGLALADGLTALCAYGFEPFFNMHYERIGDGNEPSGFLQKEDFKRLVALKFPYCFMHYCLPNLGDTFHLVSILLTTSLGLQKVFAVACPIWSKTQMNERKSFIVCGTCCLFSLVVNIPKLFVISFSNGKKGDTCLVSKPHKAIQKYILAYYPIFYAIILIGAVVTMLVSTCYIICALCRRKRVRGHATSSRAEKKSCILIVCVMMVFFLAEVPRVYISTILFSTYRSNLDMENAALHKTKNVLSQRFEACLADILYHDIADESCISEFDEQSSSFKLMMKKSLEINLDYYLLIDKENVMDIRYRYHLKENYFKYLADILLDEYNHNVREFEKINTHFLLDYAIKAFCNRTTKYNTAIELIIDDYFQKIDSCRYPTEGLDASFFILGSSPYSEPMNYIMNSVLGHIDITLEHLKLLTEILKLSMIIGCTSNFLIYIVMSEKLREALKKTFKCRKHQEDAIQMQTRG